jgi:hypothetical protein
MRLVVTSGARAAESPSASDLNSARKRKIATDTADIANEAKAIE